MRPLKILLSALLLIGVFFALVYADIPPGARCAECGMKIDPKSPFSCYATRKDGGPLYFGDIGDMLFYLKKKKPDITEVFVKDYKSHAWIDGKKAYYVSSRKFDTPMRWGIAAFRDMNDARAYGNPVGFDKAFELLK